MKTIRHLLALALAFTLLAAAPPAQAQVAGTLEAYDPNVAGTYVVATAVQPDGKMIIGGGFTTVGGAAHANLARLNADGSVDASFTASTDAEVNCVAVQADGKIVLGGDFTTVNGTARNRIARLNADGSLESTATFNPGTGANNTVDSVAVQADGKLVLGGVFTTVNGTARNRIARLNADGSLESTATFNPGTGANGIVYSVAVQADGKLVLGGNFTTINGTAINRIARLNADGSLESTATFNPGTGANSFVLNVAVQADGKLVLGGNFTTVNGTAINRIARLNADGSLESTATFNPGSGADSIVNGVAVQADGKIVLGGIFTTVNGAARNHIARLNADGSLESTATFNPGTAANSIVYSVAVQADGKIVLGGNFTTVNGTTRNHLARLANDAAPQTVSAPDATLALWSRGGSAPEVSQVTFELSTDGGTVWTPLGAGTRIGTTANWQRSSLALPASGQLRARGRTTSGYKNGGSGLVQTVGSFSGLTGEEIAVEQPAGTGLIDNVSSIAFGLSPVGTAAAVKTFTVRNIGYTTLTGLAPTSNNAEFAVNTAGFPVSLAGGASATFTVTFTPALAGAKTATLSIASSDGNENPFEVALTGQGLSFTADTDGDGLNDAAEYLGAALGFDWQVSQPALVQSLAGMANGAGLFTAAQVQALHVGTPLISRDVATGKFKLTTGLMKTTTLSPTNWLAFPFIEAGTSLNGQGELEFEFTVPDNAAFFRLEAQ